MIAFSVQKKALFRFRTQVVLELLGVQLYFVFSGTRQSTLSGASSSHTVAAARLQLVLNRDELV